MPCSFLYRNLLYFERGHEFRRYAEFETSGRDPELTLAPITRAILNRAASLRARSLLKTPDAIILATALEHSATLAVTNDRGWNKAQGIEIACVADWVGGR